MGHLPFGTGNDFSRSFGWGGHAPSRLIGTKKDKTKYMKEHLVKWLSCRIVTHDIWELQIETHEGGSFVFVKDSGKSKWSFSFFHTKLKISLLL